MINQPTCISSSLYVGTSSPHDLHEAYAPVTIAQALHDLHEDLCYTCCGFMTLTVPTACWLSPGCLASILRQHLDWTDALLL